MQFQRKCQQNFWRRWFRTCKVVLERKPCRLKALGRSGTFLASRDVIGLNYKACKGLKASIGALQKWMCFSMTVFRLCGLTWYLSLFQSWAKHILGISSPLIKESIKRVCSKGLHTKSRWNSGWRSSRLRSFNLNRSAHERNSLKTTISEGGFSEWSSDSNVDNPSGSRFVDVDSESVSVNKLFFDWHKTTELRMP